MNAQTVKPFLKWAGGKTQLLNDIEKIFPYHKNYKFTYIEPFIGSGAVLFWVLSNFPNLKSVIINDINEDLINSYRTIKNNTSELIAILERYEYEYIIYQTMNIKRKTTIMKKERTSMKEIPIKSSRPPCSSF